MGHTPNFARPSYVGTTILYFMCLACSVSDAAISLSKNLATELLHMDTPSDAFIANIFVFVAYALQYTMLGGVFELSNPKGYRLNTDKERADRRLKQVKTEIKIGLQSLIVTVGITIFYMAYLEPLMPLYNFFENRSYNIWWFLASAVAYTFWFDTYFYWSHRWLHDYDVLWNNVHCVHHRFKEPSCFAQFAVHPVEAALQGPIGHYIGSWFFPFHPAALAFFGFFSSAWAVAAHDGRSLDLNSHYYHHSKGRGRFIYFNLGFLTPFWDQICGTRWHEKHPQWIKWNTEKGKKLFDTRDGSKDAVSNDAYEAYKDTAVSTDYSKLQ